MAAFGSSSMIGDNKIGARAFLLMLWIGFLLISGAAAAIPREELDEVLPVLLLRGYNRFGNSIKISDLMKDCIALEESMETSHISSLRSHAVPPRIGVSDLIIIPSPTIVTALLPNHTLSITVRSSHGLAGAVIPLFHFPSCCCLTQSPIRATSPSLSAYAGPHALLRPQSASSNGDLLLPHPPETLDISIGFSISSTAAALTAAAIAAGVIIHLFRPYLAPHDDDMDDDDSPQHFAPLDDDMDGLVLILLMILTSLRQQGTTLVRLNHEGEEVLTVSPEQLGVRLRRFYESRHEILTQPQYAMYRTPDDVILVVDLPYGTSLHIGQVMHYFMNSPVYDNSFVVKIIPVAGAPAD